MRKDCRAKGDEQYQGLRLFLLDDFYAWRPTAILTAASVLAASSFRNMQGIRIIPAIPTRASASVIYRYHFPISIIHIRFFCEDQLGVPMPVIQLHLQQANAARSPTILCPGLPIPQAGKLVLAHDTMFSEAGI